MKKSIKLVLVLILILNIFSIYSLASDLDYKDYTPSEATGNSKITEMAGNVLGIIRNVGVTLSLITITIIGIKYMLGSVEQKAEYKKTMIPLVIGIIMLAASTTIVKIIYDFVITAI